MITETEWQKLAVGDHIWCAHHSSMSPFAVTISRIAKKKFYTEKYAFYKNDNSFYAKLTDAVQAVNIRLNAQIEKIQHQIDENLKQLEQENGK